MKYVLITGVSSGIGFSIAETLLQKGYFVFGTVRIEKDAVVLMQKYKNSFHPLIVDITDYKAIENSFETVKNVVGDNGLSALVNNSGVVISGILKHIDIQDFEYQFKVNVFGLLKMTQTFLPLLGASLNTKFNAGKIILINSISGLFTSPFIVPYCASKYATESVADGLRRELSMYGVKVVSINPGAVKTPIWNKELNKEKAFKGTDYEQFEAYSHSQIEFSRENGIEPVIIAKTVQEILKGKKGKPNYILMKGKIAFYFFLYLPKLIQDKIIVKIMNSKIKNNNTSDELSKIWLIASNIVPPIGFFLYFKHRKKSPKKAKKALIGAFIGIPVGLVMKLLIDSCIFN